MQMRSLLLILPVLICAAPVAASGTIIPIVEDSQIQVDGDNSEPGWKRAAEFTLEHEIYPALQKNSNWETRARIMADADALLVTVDAVDTEPERIISAPSKHDGMSNQNDRVAIVIDAERNSRRAYVFVVNASSATADYVTSSVGESAPAWNGAWEAASRRTPSGYSVEFRIPFTTIGATQKSLEATGIALNVVRTIGRGRLEQISLVPIDPVAVCRECALLPLRFEGVIAKTQAFRLQPYVIVARETARSGKSEVIDGGVDLLWRRANGAKLLAAINPDFSQVEIDQLQFSINRRFALSFPERRPFFTEEAGAYRTLLPLVYSRNIVDPDVGIQYIDRNAERTLAAIFATDAVTSYVSAGVESSQRVTLDQSSHNFIGRGTRTTQSGMLGALVTGRASSGGYENLVAATDGLWRVGRSQFRAQLAGSYSADPALGSERQQGFAGQFEHIYARKPFRSTTTARYVSDDFRADLGALNQIGVSELRNKSALEYFGDEGDRIDSYAFDVEVYGQWQGALDDLLYGSVMGGGYVLTKGRTTAFSYLRFARESFLGETFDTTTINGSISKAFNDSWTGGLQFSKGDALDYSIPSLGDLRILSSSLSYAGSESLSFSAAAAKSEFNSPAGTSYSISSFDARASLDVSSRHHLNLILSYGNLSARSSTFELHSEELRYQLVYQYDFGRFRYLIAGTSGYLAGDGTNPLVKDREFAFLKLVYAFGARE